MFVAPNLVLPAVNSPAFVIVADNVLADTRFDTSRLVNFESPALKPPVASSLLTKVPDIFKLVALFKIVVFAVMLAVLEEILFVFAKTASGKPLIVDELTPPILLIVVLILPVPDPTTSPVNVINWSPVFTPPTVTSPITVKVVEVDVPPAILNPFAKASGLTPLTVLFIKASSPAIVDNIPAVGRVTSVTLVVLIVVELVPANVTSLEVSKLPPSLMVLKPLSVPVPPKLGANAFVIFSVPLKLLP